MRVLGVILVFIFGMGAAFAHSHDGSYTPDTSDFAGTWQNVQVRETQVVRIVITPEDRDHVQVQVYGMWHGRPTPFGSSEGVLFRSRYSRERDQDNGAILVKVRKEFVRGDVLVRFNGRGEIVTHALLVFGEDGEPVYNVEHFTPARYSNHDEDEGRSYNGEDRYNHYEERYRRY